MKEIYDPFRATVESILEMCEKYAAFEDERGNDFLNNIRVKCKEALEYDKMFPTKSTLPTEKMSILNESLDRVANDYAEENMSEWWGGHSYVNDYDMVKAAVEFGANWERGKM